MKKCKNCGTVQGDDNTVCLDCSCPLGSSMSEAENEAAEATFQNKVNEMAEKTDEFYVQLRDKIMGYGCIGFIVIAIVLIALSNHQLGKLEPQRVTQINDIVFSEEVNIILPTERMNQLSNAMNCGWITIFTSAFACLLLLLPRMMWLLDTWQYRVFHGWDTPPSRFAMLSRKISAYIAFIIGATALIYGWILFF